MSLDPCFAGWHAVYVAEMRDERRSGRTVTAHDAAIAAFLRWLDERALPPPVSALPATLFEEYVEYLRDEHLPLQAARHAAATGAAPTAPLKHSTIRAYISVLTRWLGWLVDHTELDRLVDGRGRTITSVQLRERLERMIEQRRPLVAPRMPDLRRLPAYFDGQLRVFTAKNGVPTGDRPALRRAYLNLLRNRALIAVLFASGGRISEVLSITTADVYRGGRVPGRVPIQGKGRKRRDLRLDDLAREWVRGYLEERAAGYPSAAALFISHGPKADGKRLSVVSAWRAVKEAAAWLAEQRMAEGAPDEEVAALRDVSPHGLRHFLAQALLDEGADYKDIAQLLGHSSTVVTEQVYAQQSEERVHEVADTFAPRAKV